MSEPQPESGSERHRRRKLQLRLVTCEHFTGIPILSNSPEKCGKGVLYSTVTSSRGTYSCCRDERWEQNGQPACELFELPDPAAVEAKAAEKYARMEKAADLMMNGLSSCCEAAFIHGQDGTGKLEDHGPHFCSACRRVAYWV